MRAFLNAFPESLRAEVDKPALLLAETIKLPVEETGHCFQVRIGQEQISIPSRLYEASSAIWHEAVPTLRVKRYVEVSKSDALTSRQRLMFFCLLTRHHNGFVREEALCNIIDASESFVVPFVVELTGEYVYDILLQIGLRLEAFDEQVYGDFFRTNRTYLARQKQRMISYWNCYYRWFDYTSIDGGTHHNWRDPYIGFAIFDRFQRMTDMAETT